MDDEVKFALPRVNYLDESQINARFKSLFRQLAGPDQKVSVKELQTILNSLISMHKELKTDGFSQDSCRSMINLMDRDNNRKLDLTEFHVLWMKIENYQEVFRKFDVDRSGTMSPQEMRRALEAAGFKLNSDIFQLVMLRYTDQDLTVNFNNFVACLVHLETMFKIFHSSDTNNDGLITLNFKQWLSLTMFA
ncbi:calpain-1 catalytic subunit-like [Hemibagrus wyckioides]|uniref:calpain-1 catalytic subunit-like n=1 Tax=Hemibagrus wyckioides TaxID=337641 RepID=UPI00266C6177|nr:calpain-1 catalytic subunit-like [Hemibagrus wyckioides]XP_058251555.1 calpain-1 catalytic subunit-like [Hemibagrus wyckioides]